MQINSIRNFFPFFFFGGGVVGVGGGGWGVSREGPDTVPTIVRPRGEDFFFVGGGVEDLLSGTTNRTCSRLVPIAVF